MIDVTYKLQHGTIEEVLNGKGKEVENYEELWLSGKNKSAIFIPKVIGTYQEFKDQKYNELLTKTLSKKFQEIFEILYGERERINPKLISIVYDPDVINKEIIKMGLSKDISSRISTFNYREVPDFNKKDIHEEEYKIIEESKGEDRDYKKSYKLFLRNKESYGLTREEQIFFAALSEINNLNKESKLIKDPLTINFVGNILNELGNLLDDIDW